MNLQTSYGALFTTEEEYTSYAAQGGTLEPKAVATFQTGCEGYGGTYHVSYDDWQTGTTVSPACVMPAGDQATFDSAAAALSPWCGSQVWNGPWEEESLIGCT